MPVFAPLFFTFMSNLTGFLALPGEFLKIFKQNAKEQGTKLQSLWLILFGLLAIYSI